MTTPDTPTEFFSGYKGRYVVPMVDPLTCLVLWDHDLRTVVPLVAPAGSDGESLLIAAARSPDESLPRLMFADWCEDLGAARVAHMLRAEHPRLNARDYFTSLVRAERTREWKQVLSALPAGRIGQSPWKGRTYLVRRRPQGSFGRFVVSPLPHEPVLTQMPPPAFDLVGSLWAIHQAHQVRWAAYCSRGSTWLAALAAKGGAR